MSQWHNESEETTSKTNLENQYINTSPISASSTVDIEKQESLGTSNNGFRSPPSLHSRPSGISHSPSNFPTLTPTTSRQPDAAEHTYPDGGLQAWLVVFGSFTGMTACFGLMNTIGIFEAWISTHQLSGYSPSVIGWLIGIYIFLAFFCGVLIGPIFDAYGPRLLVAVGTVCLVGGIVGLAFSTGKALFLVPILYSTRRSTDHQIQLTGTSCSPSPLSPVLAALLSSPPPSQPSRTSSARSAARLPVWQRQAAPSEVLYSP